MTNYGYAVVTINQASGHAEQVDGVYWNAEDAADAATVMSKRTTEASRNDRHIVCSLEEVDEW